MYFYQKNFIYDISSYPKTKDTTYNILTISNLDISDLSYYYNQGSKPKILLSTGNFSPWGAKDVLLADNWGISYDTNTNTYTLQLNISNLDITNYDINQIKYLIFLDDINFLVISSNDPNFENLILKNNTILIVKFNSDYQNAFYLPSNTYLSKTSTALTIRSKHIYDSANVNFNTNAQQEIYFYNGFPHFFNFKVQRPSNSTQKILRLQLIIVVDNNNTSFTIQTYYFSSPAEQTLNTFSLTPLYYDSYTINSYGYFKLNLAWTSDGSTLTTENTTIEVQWGYYLPVLNLIINF